MPEPSESAILQRAKSLCRQDGKSWDVEDLSDGEGGAVIDDSARTEYLNRARENLVQEDRPLAAASLIEPLDRLINR
jgi:hypothetical protein